MGTLISKLKSCSSTIFTPKPTAMKAIQITEYKPYNEQDFTPKDIPIPDCGPEMVLIKTKAASINPIDCKFMTGEIDWVKPNPLTPGYDISGIVEAVGSDVTSIKVGDEVFACNWGSNKETHLNFHSDKYMPIASTFAEYAVLPACKVSKKPEGISHAEAAAISLVGLTAFQCIEMLLGEYKDSTSYENKRILILGGSGAVGYIACQIAKLGGATVYTTCSKRTEEYVKSTGADLINYREEAWETRLDLLKDVDAVFDTMGEENAFTKAQKVLKANGRYATIAAFDIGFDPNGHPPLTFASFMTLRNDVKHQDLLANLLLGKKLKLNIEETFSFTKDGVGKIFEKQASGKSMGKNVILF